uniref:DNA/RNA-binding protein Alba-like domain-containing protein n=1 Tax=Triticum urartu TaxID=4572 RepID=A0A8R7Q8E1_TRIUA
MDRYQRVEKPRPEAAAISENEIRITTQGLIRNYVTYATSLLQEKRVKEIVLKAMGQAISKTVAITEIIKKRIPGLHQDTTISSVSITDVWEPIEEGLVPLSIAKLYCLLIPWITLFVSVFIYVILLQIGDDSSCFNDLNLLVT